jgi:hypothetical protein
MCLAAPKIRYAVPVFYLLFTFHIYDENLEEWGAVTAVATFTNPLARNCLFRYAVTCRHCSVTLKATIVVCFVVQESWMMLKFCVRFKLYWIWNICSSVTAENRTYVHVTFLIPIDIRNKILKAESCLYGKELSNSVTSRCVFTDVDSRRSEWSKNLSRSNRDDSEKYIYNFYGQKLLRRRNK